MLIKREKKLKRKTKTI